jgi:hypothetical protein
MESNTLDESIEFFDEFNSSSKSSSKPIKVVTSNFTSNSSSSKIKMDNNNYNNYKKFPFLISALNISFTNYKSDYLHFNKLKSQIIKFEDQYNNNITPHFLKIKIKFNFDSSNIKDNFTKSINEEEHKLFKLFIEDKKN